MKKLSKKEKNRRRQQSEEAMREFGYTPEGRVEFTPTRGGYKVTRVK